MNRVLSILLLLALLEPAHARDTSAKLSQSSDSSSRMQLGFWPENGWVVQQFTNLVEIRFPGEQIEIVPEIGRFSGLREVTSEIRDEDTFLHLTLDCNCSVSLTGDGQGSVAIEVLAGSNAGNDWNQTGSNRGPAPRRSPLPRLKPTEQFASSGDPNDEGGIDVHEARQRLLEQLLKAAEAGIVSLEEPEVVTAEDNALAASESVEETENLVESVDLVDMKLGHDENASRIDPLQTEASESSQQKQTEPNAAGDAGNDVHPEMQTLDQAICYPPEAFEFPHVSNSHEFADQLAANRANLVGEFDQPQDDAAIAQIKLLLSLGLGHEAREVVQEFLPDHATTRLYAEISELLIAGHVTDPSTLEQSECMGDQAIWRAYIAALKDDGDAALEYELASGRSLGRMPLFLRQLVSSQIGLAFAKAGKWKDARRLESIALRAARSANETFGSTYMLSAKLSDWNGTPQSIDEHLRAARKDFNTSDTAVFEIAKRWLRSQQPAGLDVSGLIQDLAAIGRRERGTEVGYEAFVLEAKLLNVTSTREELVLLLSHGVSSGLIQETAQAALMAGLVAEDARTADTKPLALAYLDQPERYQHALEEQGFRRALARSMAEIGAPGLTKPFLRDGDLDDLVTALALTESYLEAGQVQDSFDLAATLPEGEARQLSQAAAMLASGQLDAARTLLAEELRESRNPKTLDLQKRLRREALTQGRQDIALEASEVILEQEDNSLIAEHAVILALELGQSGMPPNADRVLRSKDPETHAALAGLYRPVASESLGSDAANVSDFLSELDTEMNVIRELLEDG